MQRLATRSQPCSAPRTSNRPRSLRSPQPCRRLQQQPRLPPPAAAAEQAAPAQAAAQPAEVPRLDAAIDDELSRRPLALDAAGYFIIRVEPGTEQPLVADFYTNVINEQGLACDPATGEVISCKPGAVRSAARSWRGRTAKQLSVEILERQHGFQPCTHLEHANYLGRELQRAEFALVAGQRYVQD